jgi:endoglucanase
MLQRAAEEKNIELQYAAVDRITDGGTIHKEGIGVKTGVLSVPCRYNHTVSEMVSMRDVEKAIELLKGIF